MTLPEATELLAYWQDHPPIHLLMPALMSPWVKLKGKAAVADYAPATRISPTGADVPQAQDGAPGAGRQRPDDGAGTLAALAKRNGGRVSIDMLLGLKR